MVSVVVVAASGVWIHSEGRIGGLMKISLVLREEATAILEGCDRWNGSDWTIRDKDRMVS